MYPSRFGAVLLLVGDRGIAGDVVDVVNVTSLPQSEVRVARRCRFSYLCLFCRLVVFERW